MELANPSVPLTSLVPNVAKKLKIGSTGDLVEVLVEEEDEEDIDRELHKVDGWLTLNEGSKEKRLDDFIPVRRNNNSH
jgi:hypothetical protein